MGDQNSALKKSSSSKKGSRLKVGIVAGEKSGDMLGAGLIREIRKQFPDAHFSGLGGAAMIEQGFVSIAPMEWLSVMGLIEPLKRLPKLFALRRNLYKHFLQQQVDIVIGIDSPDFNLGLEKKLKYSGIKTCHYVCPSVWAWRQGRVKTIKNSVDHVLALLPFEADFLARHGIDATFVGHPLASRLSASANTNHANIDYAETDREPASQLCVMPGSRESEVNALLDTFLQAAILCVEQCNKVLEVTIPAATPAIHALIKQRLSSPDMYELRKQARLVACYGVDESHACIRQADVVLLASGTATLETALIGKAMVVAYKMSVLGYSIASHLVKVEHIALPNLLLNKRVVPELIQGEATPGNLAEALLKFLQDPLERQRVEQLFVTLRSQLALQSDAVAANAILSLCH